MGLLGVAVPGRCVALADALRVETHAPAAAPNPVVGLHEPGEVIPCVGRKRPCHIGDGSHAPSMSSRTSWCPAVGRDAPVSLTTLTPSTGNTSCCTLGRWTCGDGAGGGRPPVLARDVELIEVQVGGQFGDFTGHRGGVVAGQGALRAAETSVVDCDDRVMRGQHRHDAAPVRHGLRHAVQ